LLGGLEEGLGGRGPDQWLGVGVGDAEVVLDAGDQVGDAGEAAASGVRVDEFAEPVISQTAVAL
jgi:hypothetical protein